MCCKISQKSVLRVLNIPDDFHNWKCDWILVPQEKSYWQDPTEHVTTLKLLNSCQVFQFSTMTNLVQSIWRVLMWVIGRKVNERVQWGWNTASAVLQRSIEIILIAISTRMSLECQNNFWDLHCLTPTICWCMRSPKVPFVRLLTLNSPKVVQKLSREEKTNV